MVSGQVDAPDEIAAAVEAACAARGGPEVTADQIRMLLEAYYRHVPADELRDRSASDIAGAALSHRQLADQRPQGTASIRVVNPVERDDGWSADGHSVVEIVTDDMPFLVDSVTAQLTADGHIINLVIHPQMDVDRDVTGALRAVSGGEDTGRDISGDAAPGHQRLSESWMHVEIDKVAEGADVDAIVAALTKILSDVREANEDWPKIRAQALDIVEQLGTLPPPLPESEVREAEELLSWLADDHFTFLGYREYVLGVVDGEDVLRTVPGTGLGVLRSDPTMSESFGRMPSPVRAKAREKHLMIVTKANSRSTVHRPAYLDYISVKTFDHAGDVVGERRFLGLFTSSAYTESVTRIPALKRKAIEVMHRLGYSPLSHSGKALMDLLETYPRDELFQTPVDQLASIANAVLHLQERRQLRLFVRRDDYGRFLSCLVYLPRDRYTTQVRLRIERILAQAIGGSPSVDYTARVTESVLARLHFVVRAPRGEVVGEVDVPTLEQRLAEATRSWDDDFARAVDDQLVDTEASRAMRTYEGSFPEAYKEDFDARNAVADLSKLETLSSPDDIGMDVYDPEGAAPGEVRVKVFRARTPLSLSQVLPLFTALGAEVVDERPYHLERRGDRAWIYDFGLRHTGAIPVDSRALFQSAFMACWRGDAESDGFNRLVLGAGLTWRQVSLLRAYAAYMRQAGTTFSQSYLEDSLLANIPIARLLVELFEARFSPGETRSLPADSEARVAKVEDIEQRITTDLDDVASLDQDRILRSYLTLIRATVRTNYFQPDTDGQDKRYVSFKLEPRRIDDLPQPRPRYEIFVYSPRVEGVHLRFGPVARGGLRWSDRREDFRTEVLGLVKAQMVKNAVIVPVGSKGGFYCKRLPDQSVDRDAWLAEGIACYTTFLCGLLDITDNLVKGETVPPDRVVRHDADDSYLVVAADKGTAKFSDIANEVSARYGYWLGDAFASGGSVGYDHKAMGITARGGWVSVQRHFRELGVDCRREDFTCVGIGDMSGDVFGNGMLLSEHTRLVAAFDHRHIFLDPDPDPATSFVERRRLFDLPRSSWADYDSALISQGGGVHARTLKSIKITAPVRKALGIDDSITAMTPPQLMTAILRAPVDLLWNGGIGTYVKAASETHSEVGDRANDAIRVDGADLRCRCVGEGGNLGLTQLGRIEYAMAGGRLNTDFIDNSAGVDTSDHEVNIKILLDRVVATGELAEEQRNDLLAAMTDEVGRLVLADNFEQNLALANSVSQAPGLLHVHADWIKRLERGGLIDRALEFLPTPKQFAQRAAENQGLTAPELSVLLAYTKIVLADDLLGSDLADDPFLRSHLFSYFPTQMRQDYRARMEEHPLRREIVVTQVVNELVNGAGITFFHRLSGETGGTIVELARAHAVAQEIFATPELIGRVNDLDNVVDAGVQTSMRIAVRTLAERVTRWLVNNRRHHDADGAVEFFDPMVSQVVRALPQLLVGREQDAVHKAAQALVDKGVPTELASHVAGLPAAYSALGIVDTARKEGNDPLEVARLHFALGERLGLDRVVQRIMALPRDDRWRTMARATLRDDLYAVHAQLTQRVLVSTGQSRDIDDRIDAWAVEEGSVLQRAMATLDEIWGEETPDLARLSVALRVVRSLLGG